MIFFHLVPNKNSFLVQLDGNLLHTLCSQHGPVAHFMLNPTLGKAFVRYRLLEDAVKAQRHLDKCQLGNTTICAEFVPEQEVSRLYGCGRFESVYVSPSGVGV